MSFYTVWQIIGAMRIPLIETDSYTLAQLLLYVPDDTGIRVLREKKVAV